MLWPAVCITANSGCQCPLWVRSGHSQWFERCPLYPSKQTSAEHIGISALCHKKTHAPQQNRFLFDDFISRYQQVLWERNTESLSGLQVYHQLEFCRLLNREISGLGALGNLGDDIGSSSMHHELVNTVGH